MAEKSRTTFGVGMFVIGLIVGAVLLMLIPFLILATGAISFSAAEEPSAMEEELAEWALMNSVRRRAPEGDNPLAGQGAALAEGLDHYKEYCVMCHGAPGVGRAEFAEGFFPPAPLFDEHEAEELTEEFTPGELFWIVDNGIRLTGMPAFGETHDDDEIWELVLVVQNLNSLTPAQTAELQEGLEELIGGHHARGSDDRSDREDDHSRPGHGTDEGSATGFTSGNSGSTTSDVPPAMFETDGDDSGRGRGRGRGGDDESDSDDDHSGHSH